MNPEQLKKADPDQALSPTDSTQGESKESREKSFSRRALLMWSLPAAVVAVGALPASNAEAYFDHTDDASHEDHGDTPHTDHWDGHIDDHSDHNDCYHEDVPYDDHLDHGDTPHDDYTDHGDVYSDHWDENIWGMSHGDWYSDQTGWHDDVPHEDCGM
jgi:hypothetical protein